MAIIFQCPNCGAGIPDQADQSVLTCGRCGTTVTKYIQRTDQINVNVKTEGVVRNVAEEKKQQRKKIEAITVFFATIPIWLFMLFWVILMIYWVVSGNIK